MFHHTLTLRHALVVKHLCGKRNAADGRLQLVRHVVDKVVSHLGVPFLAEDNHDGEDESDKQHQCEYYRGDNKTHTRIDVAVHVGEVYLHQSHFRGGVISEQHLRVRIVFALFRIVRTAINFSTIGR